MKLKTLFEYSSERKNIALQESLNESLDILNEGGAFGHMSHPFDDLSMTFNQINDITKIALSGEIHKEEIATEKLDGQALAVSWKDGHLIAARNKGDRKNFGENAPGAQGVIDKFAGRGELSDAFGFAATDLESAISKLKDKDLQDIFGEGKKFMHLEIVYPGSKNVISYDVARLIFHSITEYDIDGEAIASDKGAAKKLQSLIKDINADIQKNFQIVEPVALKLPKQVDFDDKVNYFNKKLSKIQKEYGLNDNSTIEEFLRQKFMEDIDDKDKNQDLTSLEIEGLLRRWINGDKTFTLRGLSPKVRSSSLGKWIDTYDKKEFALAYKKHIEPLELYFLELGATILRNMSGFLAANPDDAVQDIRAEVNKAIKGIEATKDITKINKLNDLINKINSIGGFASIVPAEGVVFTYNGKTYKFTGAFAPVNQITGMLKFGN